MGERLLLSYEFVTFVVGIACLSALVVLARRQRDGLARPFLLLYVALSILVMATLVASLIGAAGSTEAAWFVQYLVAFVGRFGVMFALPFFMHRLVGLSGRDRIILTITLVTAAAQHVTEFGFAERFDELGDFSEDLVFAGIFTYSVWIGASRWRSAASNAHITKTFLVLLFLGMPGLVYDLFLRTDTAWRFYPLGYGVSSVIMTLALVRRTAVDVIPATWGLSAREKEVVESLKRGLSNKAIARELDISPNTVKTHLRAVFDKSGIRTRFGLMAALNSPEDPPERSAD